MGMVVSEHQLIAAWKAVVKNHALLGLDAAQLADYQSALDDNLLTLQTSLDDGSYSPELKEKVPSVDEFVVQELLRRSLLTSLAPTDSLDEPPPLPSVGLRCKLVDLVSRLPDDKLLEYLRPVITDADDWSMVILYLRAGLLHPSSLRLALPDEAQGGMLSPLIVNFLVDKLEESLKSSGYVAHRFDAETLIISPFLAGRAHLAKPLAKAEGRTRPDELSESRVSRPIDSSLQLGIQALDKSEHWAFQEGEAKAKEKSDKAGVDIALQALDDAFDSDY